MSLCNVRKVLAASLLIFFWNVEYIVHAMDQTSDIILEDFSDKRKNELIDLSAPEKMYVKFLVGHLFKNLEGDDHWYQNGIEDLFQKGLRKELSVKAIIVNETIAGVIWSTGTQCDIFVHPKHARRGYSRIAMGLFLRDLSGISIGVSLYNLASLKSIAHMLKNKNITATDNIYNTIKIDHNDLAYITFKKYGWKWGGDFLYSKDYQHFYKDIYSDTIRKRKG